MNALKKTGKTILNALAFANAGNQSECMALLRQFDDLKADSDRHEKDDLQRDISGCAINAAGIGAIQRAL